MLITDHKYSIKTTKYLKKLYICIYNMGLRLLLKFIVVNLLGQEKEGPKWNLKFFF